MTRIPVCISAVALLFSMCAFAEPLMPATNFIPQSREASLLTTEELSQIQTYRKNTHNYRSARLFHANMKALRSNVVDVEI